MLIGKENLRKNKLLILNSCKENHFSPVPTDKRTYRNDKLLSSFASKKRREYQSSTGKLFDVRLKFCIKKIILAKYGFYFASNFFLSNF